MTAVTQKEQRRSQRLKLEWPVCLWHEATNKFYNGQSLNISTNGALIQLPLTAPMRISDSVEVNFPSPQEPQEPVKPQETNPAKVFSATVVRVNRGQSILNANQSVALQFAK